jgi:hypothetical protein
VLPSAPEGAKLLKLLVNSKDITQAQKQFRESFQIVRSEKKRVKISHRVKVYDMEVLWLPSRGIWIASRRLSNRYWNLFGVGEPHPSAPNKIVCEINFPLSAINRRVAGVLAKNDGGVVYVFHSGRISGKPGVGRMLFQNHYRGRWRLIDGQKLLRLVRYQKLIL